MCWVGGDEQAHVMSYHILFRRNADLLRAQNDCKLSARRAVNSAADPFSIRSKGGR